VEANKRGGVKEWTSLSWLRVIFVLLVLSAMTSCHSRPFIAADRPKPATKVESDPPAHLPAKEPVPEIPHIAPKPRPSPLDQYLTDLCVFRGVRFKMKQGEGLDLMQHMLRLIPKSQYVDLIALYKAIDGLDGSTTLEAQANLRRLYIGKYYMLQGDVFQIQADRDYPREGLSQFSMFGQVKFLADYFVPVNVDCISDQKIPPYRTAAVLGRIIDFRLGENGAGKRIIIPVVRVVAVVNPSICCEYPEEVIVNMPS
jgi:hypothetical protein